MVDNSHGQGDQRQSAQKAESRERWKQTLKFWIELIAALATVAIAGLTAAYVRYSNKQWQTMQQQLNLTERARIVLGRQDNVAMDFVVTKDGGWIAVFLRNIGHTVANDVVIETWPATAPPATTIDARLNSPEIGLPRPSGPSLAPGAPYTRYAQIDANKIDQVRNGQLGLMVFGRVRYWDEFGQHCETFCEQWDGQPVRGFSPCVNFNDICTAGSHHIRFNRVTVGQKPTIVVPPSH
jgi:hypothetical protein